MKKLAILSGMMLLGSLASAGAGCGNSNDSSASSGFSGGAGPTTSGSGKGTGSGGATSPTSTTSTGNPTATSVTTGTGDVTTTGAGGATTSSATSGPGDASSVSVATGAGGAASSSASTGSGGASVAGCTPASGLEYSYACWPMPNPSSSGLPNPSSYTDLKDGTVQDNVTGLIWQQTVAASQAYDWETAKTYCSTLTLAGRVWHLPTRIELLSIVDFTRTSPAIDTKAFPGTPGGKYTWTSSPWVVSQIATKPQDSWIVNFYEGLTSNAGDRTQAEFARCVSSGLNGPLPKLYSQVATGEVQDSQTKLIWQQGDSGTTMDFSGAAPYCQALALNGHTWRVPSIKELSTLVDENPPIAKVSPAIDTSTFASTPATTPYWSSSLFNGQAATAHDPWVINFEDGFTEYNQTAALVRCVR
jgi:hypothetical protein